jgi:hypothetical protein
MASIFFRKFEGFTEGGKPGILGYDTENSLAE